MPRRPLVTIHDQVLPPSKLRELTQKVRALGGERLRSTYQTTFWFELGGEPTSVVERVLPYLEPLVPRRRRRAVGVEWWLSRMSTHDVRVDFHRDCDERLLRRGGPAVHPLTSTVFFLNRVKGGLLAITREDPCEDNPSLAPNRLDLDLVAPRPNRFAVFRGDLTHGVLDANNEIPAGKLPGPGELRLALIVNWWDHRPTDVPTYCQSGVYRSLQ